MRSEGSCHVQGTEALWGRSVGPKKTVDKGKDGHESNFGPVGGEGQKEGRRCRHGGCPGFVLICGAESVLCVSKERYIHSPTETRT